MGRVSTRGQWLIVAAGVLLSPAFVLLTAYVIGWSLLRKFRRRPEAVTRTRAAPVVAAPPR
jgi:hypothetical protein